MMLEVLVALLVFALGVLGLVGLQATAVKQAGQAKYRSDAALLANQLIGSMWVGNRNLAELQAEFSSADEGAGYKLWLEKVSATLPGVADHPPTVTFTQVNPLPALAGRPAGGPVLTPSLRVTITVKWAAPGENLGSTPHNLVMISQLK
ncbi:type IV pilus modification PilV family protein [Paucibacter sp. B51]|uniref:type IV pilus modification PilV family protein n=1 Tax=Paucibacter sp. B51 TaxID=2993315 RepID=UPI0022EBBD32|nr:hypothetical protein [Paucibacter sp. B51]